MRFLKCLALGTCLFSLVNTDALAQSSSQYQLPVVTPVSPDAAAIGKITDAPVSMYNGVPQIDIPIYTISYKGVQIPIGLSYDASGIKVEEIASSVGLGWTLNAGGVISRIVRGIPDELTNGYISGQKNVQKLENGQFNATDRKELIRRITVLEVDAEPDMFNLNLPGYSCKFFFDEDGVIHTIPESKTKITPGPVGGVGFRSWTVITSDGVKYELGATSGDELSGGIERTRNINSCQRLFDEIYNSWFLTRIVPLSGEPILFEYDSYTLSTSSRPSQTSVILLGIELGTGVGCESTPIDNCVSTTTIFSKRLKRVIFNSGEVSFVEGAARLDVSGGKKTDEISVTNRLGQIVKKAIFYHSYRTSPGGSGTEAQRLFLDSLRFFNQLMCDDGGCEDNHQVYKFEYNPAQLPPRSSTSVDYWGYYNGRGNGQYLIPGAIINHNGGKLILPGANRLPDESSTKAGILEKITYPTGGSLQLQYELNDVQAGVPYYKNQQRNYFYSYPLPPPEDDFSGIFHVQSCDGSSKVVHGVATGVMEPSQPGNPSDNKQQWRLMKWNPNANDFTILIGAFGSLTENNTLDRNYVLVPGAYKVILNKPNAGAPDYPATISLDWVNDIDCFRRPAGGLRVKETRLVEGVRPNDALITTYSYNTFSDNSKSSGFLANFPDYQYRVIDEVATIYQLEEDEVDIYIDRCILYRRSSVSNQPLSTTGRSTVGYANVTTANVSEGKNLGKTQFTFVTPNDIPDDYDMSFPFAPINSYEWKRGVLKKQDVFRANSTFTQYDIIQQTENSYAAIGEFNYRGLKTGVDEGDLGIAFGAVINQSVPKERFFSIVSGFNYNTKTITKTFDQKDGNRVMESEQNNLINSYNYNISSSQTKNSKGEEVASKIRFPVDYTTTTVQGRFAQSIKALKETNQLDLPIETYSTRKDAGGQEWVESGRLILYNGLGLPDSVFELRLAKPLALASFTPSTIHSNGLFARDSRYDPIVVFRYNADGNLSKQFKVNGSTTQYLWGYHKEFPIAECVNCTDTFAYSSFEINAEGNWTFAANSLATGGVTGATFYNLSGGAISSPAIPNGKKYIVSYWSTASSPYSVTGTVGTVKKGKTVVKGALSWTYFEHVVNEVSATQVSGSGGIDELRLYPAEGMLSTFTHIPLLGVSSQCDANSTVLSYVYDSFSRLKMIRDQFGNVVKTFEYKFQAE